MPDVLTTTEITIIVSFLFTAIAILLVFMAAKDALEDNRKIQARLAIQPEKRDVGSILKDTSHLEALGAQLTLPDKEETSKIRAELAKAGYYGTATVKTYFAIRILSIALPQFALMVAWPSVSASLSLNNSILLACVLTAIGFMAPPFFVRWKQGKRRLQIKNGFPDMLDLMVASIEAGLGLNAALLRVSEELGKRYPALR